MVDWAPRKVLVVDPDKIMARSIEQMLMKWDVNVITTDQAASAIYLFNTQLIDCVIASLDLGDMTGITLFQKFKDNENEVKQGFFPILMVGKTFTADNEGLLSEFAEIKVIKKPFDATKLQVLFQMRKQAAVMGKPKTDILARVNKLIESGKGAEAVAYMRDNLVSFGKDRIKAMADTLEKTGNIEGSIALHKKRFDANRDDIGSLNDLGRLNMQIEKFVEAEKYFQLANASAPKNLARLNEMAAMYLHLKKPEMTVDAYKEILGLTPENQDIKYDMIHTLKESGFADHARDFCNEVAEALEMIRFYNNKGVMLSKQNKVREAIVEYQKVVDFFPDFKDIYLIYFNLALSLVICEFKKKALIPLQKLKNG